MKPRLQLKPKNKLRVSTSVRLIIAGAIFATLVAAGFFLYYNFGTSQDSWAGSQSAFRAYNWRKKIKVSKDIIQGNQALHNFPLLVALTDPELRHISRGGKVIQLKGSDIQFSKSDGESPLISQIERYNPETGELLAWVMIDTLLPGKDYSLYLYFSRADFFTPQANVFWENEYQAVWHFGNSLHGDNTRRLKATVSGTSECNGIAGNGREFHATSGDYATYPWQPELDLRSDICISTWVKHKPNGNEQVIISNQGDQAGGYRLFIDPHNKIGFDFLNAAGDRIGGSGGTSLQSGQWYYISALFSLDEKIIRTYINGNLNQTIPVSDSPAPTPSALQIGRAQFNPDSYFNGMLDELRISNKLRNTSWFLTEFHNQLNASAFFSAEAAEELNMQISDLKANKNAFQSISGKEIQQKELENQLQASRSSNLSTPAPVSNNPDIVKARLDNIRRISQESRKSE